MGYVDGEEDWEDIDHVAILKRQIQDRDRILKEIAAVYGKRRKYSTIGKLIERIMEREGLIKEW